MEDLDQTIRMLYRGTVVGEVSWASTNEALIAWIGDTCFSLKRETQVGLNTRDSLSVNSPEASGWQILGVSDHGILTSLHMHIGDQEFPVSKEITMLFDLVHSKVRRDSYR